MYAGYGCGYDNTLYANDIMLLAENSNDLQQKLDRCHKEYENEN